MLQIRLLGVSTQPHLLRTQACDGGVVTLVSGPATGLPCGSCQTAEDRRFSEVSQGPVRVLIHCGTVGLRKSEIHAFSLGDTWEARHTYAFWEKVEPSQAKRRAQVGLHQLGGKLWGHSRFMSARFMAT